METATMNNWINLDRMREARGIILIEAILFLLCGLFAAVISPLIASKFLILLMGWISIACGLALFIRCFAAGSGAKALDFINAILIGGLGVIFLAWPFESLEIVTLVLAVWCFLRGLMDLSGFPQRHQVAPGVQMFSGIASIVLAILLVIWWPSDALWAPGLLFGVQLFFMSIMLFAVWNALGDAGNQANPPAAVIEG
ncbi:MAG: hypothetical protein CMJ39_02660 [Phycisphaerae bacterium]|nr:hypothetical protein [Phycisphaerae bacterium]